MPVELLLVEDDPAHAELCLRALARHDGCRVHPVESLDAARDWLRARTPDLVLADLRLPGGTATDLLAPPADGLPLVVMTSQGDQDRAVAAMKAGALDYVVKSPETFRALPEIVERALRSARHVRDRLAAEARLRESEGRFRQLAESIDGGFWLYEVAAARFIYASPGWERVFGPPVADLLADPAARADRVHPDDRDEFAPLRTPDPAHPRQGCYRVVTPGGLVRWVEERTFPVPGPGGAPHRVAGLATDVTARRALEAALQHSQKLDALGRLAGGIAHDFNNVLGVITGYASLLQTPDAPGHVGQYAREIEAASSRAAGLTRQLLAFSRNQVIAPVRVNLNRVLADMRKMLSRLLGAEVELVFDLAPALGDIRGDVGQLEQVAMNLVVNARDATPPGGRVTVTTWDTELLPGERFGEHAPPAGRYVQLSVEDTGCGMPPEVLARIFEPFFTTKEEGKGTGLGLSTVYGIVAQAHGYVHAESVPGVGTRFDILFPRIGDSAPGGAPAAAAPAPRGREVILLAEDDAQLRELLARGLSGLGYTVLAAPDGREALDLAAARRGPIDLLLTDVRMPRMAGTALAERFRALYPRAAVVLMSAHAPGLADDPTAAQADAVVPKPFTTATLAARVRAALDRHAAS